MKNSTSKNHCDYNSTQPKVRFQRAERFQMMFRDMSLNQMIPEDDTARLVWAYVEGLDLSATLRSNQSSPVGQAPACLPVPYSVRHTMHGTISTTPK